PAIDCPMEWTWTGTYTPVGWTNLSDSNNLSSRKVQQNLGPCAICRCEDTSEIFRKLTEKSLKIANNNPNTDLIVDALK
ncbi:14029_t:CDS:2, partial [Dentiscutata heterogama]